MYRHGASSPVSSAQPAIQESPLENVKVDNTIGSLMDDPTCSSRLDVYIDLPNHTKYMYSGTSLIRTPIPSEGGPQY